MPTNSDSGNVLRVGSRDSKLALVQTNQVVAAIQRAHPTLSVTVETMKTIGDKIQDVALSKFGDKGLFTKELEVALEEGLIDLVVHSLKDMPTALPDAMALAAITEREDPRDAVVMGPRHNGVGDLAGLPDGCVVGTGSVRRVAQLRRLYPRLEFRDIRGNIDTRLAKLDADGSPYDALVLAAAGLIRIGLGSRIAQRLDDVLHAVGQGALGIEVRSGDARTARIARVIDHRDSRLACLAERQLMRALEGGCSVPIGAVADWDLEGGCRVLRLRAVVVSPDGAQAVDACDEQDMPPNGEEEPEGEGEGDRRACALGARVAAAMRAKGADAILAAIERAS
ncbi:porphobilinogen deaminase [Coemansia thaxteri]|uniref:hydroxymethylbilane synthase n=1 Tax=Coemansia thaxteri TaxID=2663907 RepID=A0A9W8BKG5_9FUNG|nr:porphobilinogen deaminase [Coemansia thaxteri]KAJ2007540.1 porphobilinogen deaminase [Coemansia thaxteri]KAJ2472469.1 porphobilinogen deaminase [Coemansia sp. RSA 2322]KAJ2484611.1 porphobilinogen deaminase [Coemansia sp. RSA 2320]